MVGICLAVGETVFWLVWVSFLTRSLRLYRTASSCVVFHCGICGSVPQMKEILKWQGQQQSQTQPFKRSWLAHTARCERQDNVLVKRPARILSNFIFTNALPLVSSSYFHPREWVLESKGVGKTETAKDLESEEGFDTNCNFFGSQLSSHLVQQMDLRYQHLFHVLLNTFSMMEYLCFQW